MARVLNSSMGHPYSDNWADSLVQLAIYEDGGKALENLITKGGEKMLPLTEWLVKGNDNVKYRTVEDVMAVSLLLSLVVCTHFELTCE